MPATAHWRTAMKSGQRALRRGRVSLPGVTYFVTTVVADRRPVFTDHDAAIAACRALTDPALHHDSALLAWVLMPDHAHALLTLGDDDTLPSMVGRLKSAMARTVHAAQPDTAPLWQRGYHDRALRSDQDLRAAARYLVGNPLRAGLVQQIGDYPYWNAAWL